MHKHKRCTTNTKSFMKLYEGMLILSSKFPGHLFKIIEILPPSRALFHNVCCISLTQMCLPPEFHEVTNFHWYLKYEDIIQLDLLQILQFQKMLNESIKHHIDAVHQSLAQNKSNT